jgi:hypothetical protein
MSEELKPRADADGGLDGLFRNTLESHRIEPSRNLWKGISRKLLRAELSHFNFINLPRAFWIGAAGALVVGIVFLVNQIPDGKTTEEDYAPIIMKKSPDGNANPGTSGNIAGSTRRNLVAVKEKTTAKPIENGSPVRQTSLNGGPPVSANKNSTQIRNTNKTEYAALLPSETKSLTSSASENNVREDHLSGSQVRNASTYELKYLPVLSTINLLPS